MIPATTPKTVPAVEQITYDGWEATNVWGERPGPGRFSVGIRLTRARTLPDGNSDLSPDPFDSVAVFVENINADPGPGYPADVRAVVQQAAAGLMQAAYAVGTARGQL